MKVVSTLVAALLLPVFGADGAQAATPQAILDGGASAMQSTSMPGIFGALELRTNAARGAQRWPEVMARATAERRDWLACERGSAKCPPKLKAWRDGLAKARDLSRWQQIVEVNRLVNSLVQFRNDIDTYGVADHWATPKETLSKSGDCEDFVILKYLSLRELGFTDNDMRMVVVKITRRGIGHAVLAVNHDGGRFILDNLLQRPVEHSAVKGYKPVYSVNARGQWLALEVKPATTQVASLEPVMPSRTAVPAQQSNEGLKLADDDQLAAAWDMPVSVSLPPAGWGYALAQPVSLSSDMARAAHPMPRI